MDHLYADAACRSCPSSGNKSKADSAVPVKNCGGAAETSNTADNFSIGIEDVRIRYSSEPPIQRKPSHCDVVQLASHIHALRQLDSTNIPVIPSEKPTMVFESMGTSNAVMENVYTESRKYKGNTVCVFGLNKKQGDEREIHKAPDRSEIPHHLVNFSFEWSNPVSMNAGKGYEMPFIEARREIMEQAKRLTFSLCNPEGVTAEQRQEVITPTDDARDLSWSPVYRWIDGDAKDDSSNDLDINFIRRFALQTDPYVATGAYEWRHEDDVVAHSAPQYNEFIKRLNREEALLRETYMRCMHEEVHTHEREGEAYAYGDFYLPESTFVMNGAAHNRISSDRNEMNFDGDQTRESMRFFSASGMGRDKILYKRQLHVTKPLKGEFKDDGYAKSLMCFFTSGSYSRDALAEKLGELRQSAFGRQWDPTGDDAKAEYRQYKEECINRLDTFLTDQNRFASIQQEIMTLRERQA